MSLFNNPSSSQFPKSLLPSNLPLAPCLPSATVCVYLLHLYLATPHQEILPAAIPFHLFCIQFLLPPPVPIGRISTSIRLMEWRNRPYSAHP